MSGVCRKAGLSNYAQKCIKKIMHYCKQRNDYRLNKALDSLIDQDSNLMNPLLEEVYKEGTVATEKQYYDYITKLKNAQSPGHIQIEQLTLDIQQLKQKISAIQIKNAEIDRQLSKQYETERHNLTAHFNSKLEHITKESSVRLDKIIHDFMIKNGLETEE